MSDFQRLDSCSMRLIALYKSSSSSSGSSNNSAVDCSISLTFYRVCYGTAEVVPGLKPTYIEIQGGVRPQENF